MRRNKSCRRPSFSPSVFSRQSFESFSGIENISSNILNKNNHCRSRQSFTPKRVVITPNITYLSEILESLYRRQLSPDAVMTDLIHSDITPNIRYRVVEWIAILCKDFSLRRSVMYSSVAIIDRSLQSLSITKSQLQLIGGVSLWISTKFYCPNVIRINQIITKCGDSSNQEQFHKYEEIILEAIDNNVNVPNVSDFISLLEENMSCDRPLLMLLWTLSDMHLQFAGFLRFKPSTIAAAIMIYSLNCLNRTFQNEIVTKLVCTEDPKQLYYCIEDIHNIVSDLVNKKKKSVIEQTNVSTFNQAKKWLSRATLPDVETFILMLPHDIY